MSKIVEVIRNKNKTQRLIAKRRKEEINKLREDTIFRALLREEFNKIDEIFKRDDIEAVIIEVPDKYLPRFGEAIYSFDLDEYVIQQDDKNPNKFFVRRKIISF